MNVLNVELIGYLQYNKFYQFIQDVSELLAYF